MISDGVADRKQTSDPSDKSETVAAPVGCLAIVFTDIEDSTGLWETWPDPMRKAMTLHDQLLRAHLETYRGYEVKTIGDGYMVAFGSALQALNWCFDVQEGLVKADWPPEVLQSPHAAKLRDEAGNVVFAGLSVRMSAHWGSPICVTNMITRRMDYIGPMIHRPARAIDLAKGGQIVTTRAFLERVQTEFADEDSLKPYIDEALSDTLVSDLGEHQLKGLSTSLQLFSFLPRSLRGRVEHFPDDAVGRPIDAFRMSQATPKNSSSKYSFNPGGPNPTRDTVIGEVQVELAIGLSPSREMDYTEVLLDHWNEPVMTETTSQPYNEDQSEGESGENSACKGNFLGPITANPLPPSLDASREIPFESDLSGMPGAFFATSATSAVYATGTAGQEAHQSLLGKAYELAHSWRNIVEDSLQKTVEGSQICLHKLQSAEMGLFLILLAFMAIFVGMALNVVGTLQPLRYR